MTKKRRSRKGFTLVELMIVVVILLILSAIAIPIYLNYVDDARRSQAAADVKIVAGSMSKMFTDVGAAPVRPGGSATGVVGADPVLTFKPISDAEWDTYFPAGTSRNDWKGPYLNTWPEGPKGWKVSGTDAGAYEYFNLQGAQAAILFHCYGQDKVADANVSDKAEYLTGNQPSQTSKDNGEIVLYIYRK